MELIRSFFIPRRILPPKEHKINKQLVTFRNNKEKCRSGLSLKVGYIRNSGDGVSDKVSLHWQLQVFLKTPSCMRQIIPLFQLPKCSHAKRFPSCKITLAAACIFFISVGMVGIKTKILRVRPFICMQ